MHSFTWNGKSSADFGIMIEKDPDKNRPARKFSVANVAGRNGNLYDISDSFEEVQRTYNLFCSVGNEPNIRFKPVAYNGEKCYQIKIKEDNTTLESLVIDFDYRETGYTFTNTLAIFDSEGNELYHIDTVLSDDFIYKGNYEIVSGVLSVTHDILHVGDLSFNVLSNYDSTFLASIDRESYDMPVSDFHVYYPSYAEEPFGSKAESLGDKHYTLNITQSDGLQLVIKDTRHQTVADFEHWVENHYFLYPYSEPHTFEFGTNEIILNKGEYYIQVTGGRLKEITKPTKSQNEMITEIMEWLYEPKGYSELSDTYDPDHYREAVLVDTVSVRDLFQKYGRAQVTFRCRPERFLTDDESINIGVDEYKTSRDALIINNPTKHESFPMIQVINHKDVPTLFTPTNITNVVYPSMSTDGGFINISTSHFYVGVKYDTQTNLVSIPEANMITNYTFNEGTLTFTSAHMQRGLGVNIPVSANMIYTLSVGSTSHGNNDTMFICFCDGCGNIIDRVLMISDIPKTFQTTSNTEYIVVIFYTLAGQTTTISDIMLNEGDTALPFAWDTANFLTHLYFNDIQIKITKPFTELYIDCESQNVYNDFSNFNRYTIVETDDEYLIKPSTKFPTLMSGENTVYHVDTDISYVIQPKYWEL